MLYSFKNQYPQELPERVRLPNGLTRTDSNSFTAEELDEWGYVAAPVQPGFNSENQQLGWDGSNWFVIDKIKPPLTWQDIRKLRDEMIKDVEWRVNRNLSETRLGIPTTDDIAFLDAYIQSLRDITKQEDPNNIVWPTFVPNGLKNE